MSASNPHAEIDRANLEQDRAAAAALRKNPELIEFARENLNRWLKLEGDVPHPALSEWRDILFFLRLDQIADFLESESPKANRLRQSSPFIGILRHAGRLKKERDATLAT